MAQSGSVGDILHPLDAAEWHLWVLRISKIIARAWTDEAFKDQLIADPAAALRAVGLAVPEGAEVVVEDGATGWSMSGSSLARLDRLTLPLPPKPTADALLKAWAEGETGHPPILSDQGMVAFAGLPANAGGAAPWRAADGRRVAADGGYLTSDAAARRVAEARRIVDDSDFSGAEAAARRTAEARRIVEDDDPPALDAAARRATEARRIVDDTGPEGAASLGRRTAEGRRVGDDEGPAEAAGRRVTEGRRMTEEGDGPGPSEGPGTAGQKPTGPKK